VVACGNTSKVSKDPLQLPDHIDPCAGPTTRMTPSQLPGRIESPVHTERPHMPRPILTNAELASVRREYRAARLLPARTYHDPAILEWERDHIVRTDWVLAAREEDVAEPTSFIRIELDGEDIIVVRGRDEVIRAFYNVCQHRGTAFEERECGKAVRFQCPYHAW